MKVSKLLLPLLALVFNTFVANAYPKESLADEVDKRLLTKSQESSDSISKKRLARERLLKNHDVTIYNGRPAIRDELIVGFKDSLSSTSVRVSVHREKGIKVKHRFRAIKADLVQIPNTVSFNEAITYYQEQEDVLFAEPNYIIMLPDCDFKPVSKSTARIQSSAAQIPNDPMFAQQWSLHNTGKNDWVAGADIDALNAWTVTKGSNEIVVAVIDSGVDYNHEDLRNQMWVNTKEKNGSKGVDDDNNGFVDDIYGYDFLDNDCSPMDMHKHGTHVSGIIAAQQNNNTGISGIAPNTRIMALRFIDEGGFGISSDAIECIDYAAANGAHITNCSWGNGGELLNLALYNAFKAAGELIHVTSAGNDSLDVDKLPDYPGSFNLPNIINVCSSDEQDKLSSFSNFGRKRVDIAAPGSNILSCVMKNKYAELSGTSMAAPHVAGVVALLKAQFPNQVNDDLITRLLIMGNPMKGGVDYCLSGRRLDAFNVFREINFPPTAISPKIQGDDWVNSPLTAKYTYHDQENDPETAPVINWYIRDSYTGAEQLVAQNTMSYTPGQDLGGFYVYFDIVPASSSGNRKGFLKSSLLFGPIKTDYPIVRIGGANAKSSDYVCMNGFSRRSMGPENSEVGIVYSRHPNPTLDDDHVLVGKGSKYFDCVVRNLKPSTKYYFRYYGKNSRGTSYSQSFAVETLYDDIKVHKLMPVYYTVDEATFGDPLVINDKYAIMLDWYKAHLYTYDSSRDVWTPDPTVDFLDPSFPNNLLSKDSVVVFGKHPKTGIWGFDNYKKSAKKGKWQLTQSVYKRYLQLYSSFNVATESEIYALGREIGGTDTTIHIFERDKKDRWKLKESVKLPQGLQPLYPIICVDDNHMCICAGSYTKGEESPVYFYSRNSFDEPWHLVLKYTFEHEHNGKQGNIRVALDNNLAVIGELELFKKNGEQAYESKLRVLKFSEDTQTWDFHQSIDSIDSGKYRFWIGPESLVIDDTIFACIESNKYSKKNGYVYDVCKLEPGSDGKYKFKLKYRFYKDSNDMQFTRSFGDIITSSKNFLAITDFNNFESGPWNGATYIFLLKDIIN